MIETSCVGRTRVYDILLSAIIITDDEILDVNGITITGMTVTEVGHVIRSCPDEFLATVRPITALRKLRPPPDITRVNYVTVLPNLLSPEPKAERNSSDSFDDVGNYDDEDEEIERSADVSTCAGMPRQLPHTVLVFMTTQPKVGTCTELGH